MRAVFVGPPGSGKGTQANLLNERLGLTVIGTGEILREAVAQGTPMGIKAKPYLEGGKLAPDELVNGVVAERLRRANHPTSFILDGYPRNAAQAVVIDGVLTELGLNLKCAVHFRVDDDVVTRRLLARQRSDDDKRTILNRLEIYRGTCLDLLNHYRNQGILHEVDADGLVEHLYVTIASVLLSTKR